MIPNDVNLANLENLITQVTKRESKSNYIVGDVRKVNKVHKKELKIPKNTKKHYKICERCSNIATKEINSVPLYEKCFKILEKDQKWKERPIKMDYSTN